MFEYFCYKLLRYLKSQICFMFKKIKIQIGIESEYKMTRSKVQRQKQVVELLLKREISDTASYSFPHYQNLFYSLMCRLLNVKDVYEREKIMIFENRINVEISFKNGLQPKKYTQLQRFLVNLKVTSIKSSISIQRQNSKNVFKILFRYIRLLSSTMKTKDSLQQGFRFAFLTVVFFFFPIRFPLESKSLILT